MPFERDFAYFWENLSKMADNYLEKRYEEVFGKNSGVKPSAHRQSLETLLRRSRTPFELDTAYPVNRKQLDLIAEASEGPFSLVTVQEPARIEVYAAEAADPGTRVRLGMALEAMLLRAFDLGLAAEPVLPDMKNPDDTGSLLATLVIGKIK